MPTFADRFLFILQLEKERFIKRGLLNNLIGWGTLIAIYTCVPPLVKSIWPAHIENPFVFYLLITTFLISFATPLYSLIYLPGTPFRYFRLHEVESSI